MSKYTDNVYYTDVHTHTNFKGIYTEYVYYTNINYFLMLLFSNSFDNDDTLKKNSMPFDDYSYINIDDINNTVDPEMIYEPLAVVTPKDKKQARNYEKCGDGKKAPQIASNKL